LKQAGAKRAAVCIHLGSTATRDQQERLATEYCERHGIEPTTLVFHPGDALKLIREGLVDTVVVAYLPADRVGLAEEVTAAGGVLREARERRRHAPAELVKVFIRLFDRGMSVAEISALTDETTGEIRAELFKRGRREGRT
jgi:hypothetical protein